MSQIPPPPSQPAPMGGSAAGSNKNLYTILAWVLFPPIGSLIFLFVGKDDTDVKYSTALAVVDHGGAFIVYRILWVLAVIINPLFFLVSLFGLVWFVTWVVGLIVALQAGGNRVNLPVVGPRAARYVPMVEGWAK